MNRLYINKDWSTLKKLLVLNAASGGATPKTETVSGSIVTFSTTKAVSLIDCKVDITPTQAGSGDPSPENVRPITGWTGAKISQSGADTSNPTVYNITFPSEAGIVYGGTLDVTTGELIVTHCIVSFNGSEEDWQFYDPYYQAFKPLSAQSKYDNANGIFWTCNILKPASYSGRSNNIGNFASIGFNGNNVALSAPGCTTLDQFKAWLADHPLQFGYELNTPKKYGITPQGITALSGNNTMWADTGDITVTYRK